MYETNDKMVSHPSHYQSETGLEVIDVIEAFTSDLKGIEATDTGNIIKYMCRWKKKNGIQDLEKAMWYLNHLITHVKELNEDEPREERSVMPEKFLFPSRKSAEQILFELDGLIKKYGSATIADYYELLEKSNGCTYIDSLYGWTNLENANIIWVAQGDNHQSHYEIVFPATKQI